MAATMRIGGVILCGGKSSRMGQPKLSLHFGDELMLPRVCRILSEVVSPIVVVAATDQVVPDLPAQFQVVRDEYDDQGPLAGIATGLGYLRSQCDAAFITACDAPLLKPEFIKYLIDQLAEFDAVVPVEGEFEHVLTAVYRTSLEVKAREFLAAGRRRILHVIQELKVLRISAAELRDVDPELDSLRNTNTPADYADALRRSVRE
jgi:molybdopterin-guanine dinucleotide biosynthesis protein A